MALQNGMADKFWNRFFHFFTSMMERKSILLLSFAQIRRSSRKSIFFPVLGLRVILRVGSSHPLPPLFCIHVHIGPAELSPVLLKSHSAGWWGQYSCSVCLGQPPLSQDVLQIIPCLVPSQPHTQPQYEVLAR